LPKSRLLGVKLLLLLLLFPLLLTPVPRKFWACAYELRIPLLELSNKAAALFGLVVN
jgi:hypothetical protein